MHFERCYPNLCTELTSLRALCFPSAPEGLASGNGQTPAAVLHPEPLRRTVRRLLRNDEAAVRALFIRERGEFVAQLRKQVRRAGAAETRFANRCCASVVASGASVRR